MPSLRSSRRMLPTIRRSMMISDEVIDRYVEHAQLKNEEGEMKSNSQLVWDSWADHILRCAIDRAGKIAGEAIKAHLVLHQGRKTTLKAICSSLKGKLPEYKMPHYIEIMDGLPRNVSGKIMKSELQKV